MKLKNIIISIALSVVALYYYIVSKATLINIIIMGAIIFLIVSLSLLYKSSKKKKELTRIEEVEKAKELGKLKARIELGIKI